MTFKNTYFKVLLLLSTVLAGCTQESLPQSKVQQSSAPPDRHVICSMSLGNSSPVAFNGLMTQNLTCTGLISTDVVFLKGTKDNANELFQILNMTGTSWSGQIANDNATKAGSYARHIEVKSNLGADLFNGANVFFVLAPNGGTGTPDVSCTYSVRGPNPLPFNQSGAEEVSCSNVPQGASVHLVSFKDGNPQFDTPITLTGTSWSTPFVNNNPEMQGTYVRHVEVRQGTNVLFATADVSLKVLGFCTYRIDGTLPLAFGGHATQALQCVSLPAGSKIKLVGTLNTVTPVNGDITLTAGAWSQPFHNIDMEGVGVWVLHVEIQSSSGTIISRTDTITAESLGPTATTPKCTYQVSPLPVVPWGANITETVNCENMPANATAFLVSYIGETLQFNAPLTLTDGNYTYTGVNDNPANAATYRRWVEIVPAGGTAIFRSAKITTEVKGP